MKPRLLILVATVIILSVVFASRTTNPLDAEPAPHVPPNIKTKQRTLSQRKLPGEEPAELPEFNVQTYVDPTGDKDRLYFDITETHGYYVETMRLTVWHKDNPDQYWDESPLVIDHYINNFIRAGQVLSTCLEVTPPELARINGDIGTSANWEAEVDVYNRARDRNPDPLPLVSESSCD